ncbi:sacsin N-terminal ATP-binding-like domain-containing protein [Nocardia aurea]|uniref:sacsin N-terminal ATP-binding-like domain-containing protein n=1 Tax=Nocardia aurea TaxID=2144174 RepID=UPI0018E50197|nr:ATP-binding protein [Nocardia aurea]
MADPFGSERLRSAVLTAWRDSPTRLREDAATEADLVRSGYRDRLLTELAQNAADAAAEAGVPGRVSVRLDGRTLRIANTGAPLDIEGVHSLTALRVSGKVDPDVSVGRFGVGFTAVLSVSDDIELRSTTGSLSFSRERTRAALRDNGIRMPGETAPGTGDVEPGFLPPVLRLTWPLSDPPAPGADTEVVLRLRDEVDERALVESMRAEAVDLLLELPALHSIRIGDDEITSAVTDLDNGLQELRITVDGRAPRIWWQFRTARARWLVPVRQGRPVAADDDVLRAPTRSDEDLSLPALLVADIPMQPDRRRLLPGARIAELAAGYADFARALPRLDRLVLVPTPGFARGEADALLREAVIAELRANAWLPVVATTPRPTAPAFDWDPLDSPTLEPAVEPAAVEPAAVEPAAVEPAAVEPQPTTPGVVSASGRETSNGYGFGPDTQPPTASHPEAFDDGTARDFTAIPTRASVLTGLSRELAALLDDMVGPLVIPELSRPAHTEALAVLDVHRLGLARLAELSGGLERTPDWWRGLYDALEPFVADPLAAEELGALAVPLADGRVVTGPRTVVLGDRLDVAIPLHWARLVHPEAAHPLLARLGARSATPEDLLNDPGLHAELEDHPDDPEIADAILLLAAHAEARLLPSWLGLLELPDTDGDLRPADELLLPGAPLYPLLPDDTPLGTLAEEIVDRYGAQALRAIGVGWDFAVVVESDPTGPDHDLDDEESWWATLTTDPREFAAVRDLDLVDEVAWPDALLELVSQPQTRRLVADPDGYTAWWLRRHARIHGTRLGLYRHPADTEFTGLLPEFTFDGFTQADLDGLRAVFVDPAAMTTDLAEALLDALADPSKTPAPDVVAHAHRLLAAAVADDRLDLSDLDLPERVRVLSGEAADPGDVMVLDLPWFGLVVPSRRLVLGGADGAPALARLLDLPLVSESVTAEVVGAGRRTSWSAEPLGVVLRQLFTLPPQDGELVVHDDLTVRLSGAVTATISVPWWREGATTHLSVPRAVSSADENPYAVE